MNKCQDSNGKIIISSSGNDGTTGKSGKENLKVNFRGTAANTKVL